MALIPEGVIDEIQARADIAELIGRYVPLRRAGRHFKAVCPFHQERTPSFMVNTEKQIFHCFGCGVGGNIFSFLMQHDRLTFPEAVRQLADHVGVHVPESGGGASDGSQERLLALMEKICRYYERLLAAPQAASARAYLSKRGVSEQTRRTFRLGVAPTGWTGLITAAKATEVSADQLEGAGLAIRGKTGHYDRFRNRLIFPIMDVRGRVVGFGGRSLDRQDPKYLNSPETSLYSKGRHLFGLSQAKDAILAAKTAVVVEGYFDCVVLADGGVPQTVSPLGTALTIEQARLLKRYAEQVILAFDADAAGEQATLRGVDLLVDTGLHVRVAQLPQGMDPDECLRSYGRERFLQLLDHSVSIFDFLVETARRRFPGKGAEQHVRAAQFVLPTIAKVPNVMLRSEYVKLLAERFHLDEAAVAQELAKVQPRTLATAEPVAAQKPGAGTAAQGAERLLTGLVLDDPSRWQRVRDRLSLSEVTDPTLRRILTAVCELGDSTRHATPAQIVSRLAEEGYGSLVTELVTLSQSVVPQEEALEECVKRLQRNTRRREHAKLREQIRIAEEAGNEIEVQRLLTECQEQIKGG